MLGLTRNTLLHNISNYCKLGDIDRIKAILDSKSTSDKTNLVKKTFSDGGTCLITACRHGHLPVVEYLVDQSNADVEQVGSVMFDGEQVEGVPPMWCAAAAGHLGIVKFLIDRRAEVNKITITNSTALRAACFDGHHDVVRYLIQKGADIEIPNRHGHTCLMISCYRGHCKIVEYLLKKSARVNRTSAKGNTALHDCAESGNLESLKLLIQYGAEMRKDEYGLTPIMAGANAGYKEVVDYLATNCPSIATEEKAQAYELLGANMLDRHSSLPAAFKAWNQAMKLRKEEFGYCKKSQLPPGLREIEKPPLASSADSRVPEEVWSRLRKTVIDAFGDTEEFTDSAELTTMAADNPDKLRLQTLLIRLRILGPDHPDTVYFIRYRGAIYADTGDIRRCLSLWMYALELQRLYLEPLCHVAQSAFLSFAELFIYILTESYSAMPSEGLSPEIIVDCLDLCVENISRGQEFSYYQWHKRQPWSYTTADKEATNLQRHVAMALHYISMLQTFYMEPSPPTPTGLVTRSTLVGSVGPSGDSSRGRSGKGMSEKTRERFMGLVYRLVRLDPRVHKGYTLVHLVCSPDTAKQGRYQICPFPNEDVLRLLLELGANPDVPDADGSRPVNLVVSSHTTTLSTEERGRLLRILLEYGGAHLDARDRRGKSAVDARGSKCLTAAGVFVADHVSLKCLCARVVKRNQLPFGPENLPEELIRLLELH